MKSKDVNKDRTRAVERGSSRKRRGAGKGGGEAFGLLSSLAETEAHDVVTQARTGRGTSRSKAARPGTVLRGHVRGNRLLVLSIPGKELPSFRRLMGRVIQEVNTVGVEAVARALERRSEPPPAPAEVPASERWRQTEAARWAEIRKEWLDRHPALPAAEVARLAGSTTVNPSALLNGWLEARRIFGVTQGRRRLYPAFQIGQDGQPKEQFRTLLTALGGKLDGWPLAMWLTKPNAEFDDWATPLDVVERDPDAVAAAARIEVQEASY